MIILLYTDPVWQLDDSDFNFDSTTRTWGLAQHNRNSFYFLLEFLFSTACYCAYILTTLIVIINIDWGLVIQNNIEKPNES